jgi:hypothetical protein
MCGCSLLGNREVSRSANDAKRCWSAAGRRGAVAADVRAREVRPGHSSSEADEQARCTVTCAARARWTASSGASTWAAKVGGEAARERDRDRILGDLIRAFESEEHRART